MDKSKSVIEPAIMNNDSLRVGVFKWAGLLLACCAALWWINVGNVPERPKLPSPQLPPEKPVASLAERAALFDQQVTPVIKAADTANREAAVRCLRRLQDVFDRYRKGIPPLTEDLTSWGTRWNVIKLMPTDWWYEQTDVKTFVEQKFEDWLFSEKKLKQDIEGAISGFREDVAANNRSLLTQVRAAISESRLSIPPTFDSDQNFEGDLIIQLKGVATDGAVGSVQNLVLNELVSGVGGYAAEQLVFAIATRLSTVVAASATASAGATASSGAIGGGAGSSVGPVGTVVGIGAGLAVGVIIDWWMSDRFEAELSVKLNSLIDEMALAISEGTPEQVGVRSSLNETCDALRDAYRDSIFQGLTKEVVQ